MQMYDLLQMIQSGEVNSRYFTKVNDQWNRFQEGREVDNSVVPQEYLDSWKRCRAYGLDPYDLTLSVVENPKQKEFFLNTVKKYEFYLQSVFEIFDLSDFLFKLQTRDGICQLLGQSTLTLMDCSEKNSGTTSSSIVLYEDKPAVIFQPFYYRQTYVRKNFGEIHGASAPIHNEKNELIGDVVLLYHYPELSLQAFHMVSLIAKIFDYLYWPLAFGHERQLEQIMNCLPQGIALGSKKETINFCNEKMVDLFEIRKKQNTGQGRKKSLPVFMKAQNDLYTFNHIKGKSPLIQKAKNTAEKIADTYVPVMIYGESGTGKEMFAQAIHNASSRSGGPFIAINCGAIPGELVESELFGYEEGAFTGASKGGKVGKIEAASGGTLFLDEIESMPLKDQIKLLRVLSTGKVQKIGSTKEVPVNVRLISATKTDLLQQADESLFREDLYYRISTFIVELPPLRERKEDIIFLAEEFIQRLEKRYSRSSIDMDWSFINALLSYKWRGNVRELEHAMEHAVIMLDKQSSLLLEHLPEKIQDYYLNNTTEEIVEEAMEHENKFGLLALAEQKMIERVLDSVDGNISAAAEQLGINRRTIYRKLQRKETLDS